MKKPAGGGWYPVCPVCGGEVTRPFGRIYVCDEDGEVVPVWIDVTKQEEKAAT